ncbi:hypothetical protein N656DRAFT_108500 [Canariomyces notabilis]|uniref:Uncharacterized protein n=1 Tax=Canariomyces notabilis TaxID=2074819 RepID=A0AAN6TCW5_9PEZI|nr:hypothetical protein N656DRAFT_108500 [Canariomyces arenarius]
MSAIGCMTRGALGQHHLALSSVTLQLLGPALALAVTLIASNNNSQRYGLALPSRTAS